MGQTITSGPKFTILWGHVEQILLLNKFFFGLSLHALVAKIQPDKVVRRCLDVDFLGAAFVASDADHVSDLHLKYIRTKATPCDVEAW